MKKLSLFAFALAGLVIGAVSAQADVLRVAAPAPVVDIDPHGPNSVLRDTLMAGRQIYDPLVEFKNGEAVGRLATAWQQVDATTWRFTLRDGVTFHDGSAFDAADVVASLERQAKAKGGLARLWGQFASVTAVDAATVEIKLKDSVGPFLRNVSLLHIVPSEAVKAAGEAYGADVRLPGTGPFKVKSFEPGQVLEVEANAAYWDGAPKLEGVRFLSIPELSGRITALLNDEIDVTWGVPDDQIPSLMDKPDVKVEIVPSVVYLYSWFNSGRKPFTDARVRRALWHAINIEQIVKDLLPVTGKLAKAPIASTVFGFVPQEPYKYDPELAKKLLAEAGYANGLTGELKYSVNFGAAIDQIAQTYSAYWEAIGVKIRPVQLEHAVFTEAFRTLNWDIMMATNPTYTEDADYTLGRLYVSPEGVNEENGFVNAELHEALMAAKREPDQAKRMESYAKATKIIWDDAAGIFPAELMAVYAYRTKVKGLDLAPTMTPRFRATSVE
jgi:peptide/nickel transport system substrate-binding protein